MDEEKTKPDPVPVRVVGEKGESSLVEYQVDGMYRRRYVPAKSVKNREEKRGEVVKTTLDKGIVYGLPWEDFIEITATPESVANELRRRGVWYTEDMTPSAIVHARIAFDYGDFISKAKQEVDR